MPKTPPQIFDVEAYARRRARADRGAGDVLLACEAAQGLAERLAGFNREFQQGLDLFSRAESFASLRPFAVSWTHATLSPSEALGIAPQRYDLVTSVLALHAVNDLPGVLLQIRGGLKPGGLFLAALFGGSTLSELRQSFAAAETELLGGVTPRVAPFGDVRDLGALLQRAGFSSPVADVERTTVRYDEINRLFVDLKRLGETNVLALRSKTLLSRKLLAATLSHYAAHHADSDGRLRATFDIVYLTGWVKAPE